MAEFPFDDLLSGGDKSQRFEKVGNMVSAPAVGSKTITATAAELFAGASAKAGRRLMVIKNEDQALRFRVGPSGVTQQTGFPVEPGATVELSFDSAISTPIYAISEGASIQASVAEV